MTPDGTSDDRDKQCNDRRFHQRRAKNEKKPDEVAVLLFSSDKDADHSGEDVLFEVARTLLNY